MRSSALPPCGSRGRRLGARWLLAGVLIAVLPCHLSAQASAYEELQTFSAVLNHLRLSYVDSVTYAEMVRAAIDGVLRALDPHSYFVSRRDWEKRSAFERGDLAVTGMVLDDEDSAAAVLAVVPRSPAEKAGVLPGDRVVQVDDTSVVGLKVRQVELLLAGPSGSKVHVTLERGTRLEPDRLAVTLTRAFLKQSSVGPVLMADPVTGYLRLEEFGLHAAEEVHKSLRQLKHAGARQLVLDLRGNPGGLIDAAVAIASEFLPKGTVVFRTRGRKRDATQDYVTKSDGDFIELPMVVLINQRSASASEALAGSLQDHDRALIVGRRSFGKALVQTGFFIVPSGDLVELTIAPVFTPSGRTIQRRYKGIAVEQYWSFAGKSGAVEDTAAVFRTDHGRAVRGGGGIVPDVVLPAPRTYPVWWSVALDSGLVFTVADSVAQTLPASPAGRAQ
jgi:carboxyl-terminal processing protease